MVRSHAMLVLLLVLVALCGSAAEAAALRPLASAGVLAGESGWSEQVLQLVFPWQPVISQCSQIHDNGQAASWQQNTLPLHTSPQTLVVTMLSHACAGTLRELTGMRRPGAGRSLQQHRQAFLETAQHGHVPLQLPPNLAATIEPGARVQIKYSRMQGQHVVVDRMHASQPDSQRRRLLQSRPTAPKGITSMIIFIMDLSQCGTASPAITPEVRRVASAATQHTPVCNSLPVLVQTCLAASSHTTRPAMTQGHPG